MLGGYTLSLDCTTGSAPSFLQSGSCTSCLSQNIPSSIVVRKRIAPRLSTLSASLRVETCGWTILMSFGSRFYTAGFAMSRCGAWCIHIIRFIMNQLTRSFRMLAEWATARFRRDTGGRLIVMLSIFSVCLYTSTHISFFIFLSIILALDSLCAIPFITIRINMRRRLWCHSYIQFVTTLLTSYTGFAQVHSLTSQSPPPACMLIGIIVSINTTAARNAICLLFIFAPFLILLSICVCLWIER